MFSVSNRNYPPSGGLSRRELLRVGALGLSGLTLADLLRHEATAADSEHPTVGAKPKRPKSVIYIVLNGGPSHIDMWDLKPQAPLEYRGPFSPIATKLPGVQICEHMPRQAVMLDRCTLIRSYSHKYNSHNPYNVLTGFDGGNDRENYFAKRTDHPEPKPVVQQRINGWCEQLN